MKKRMLAITAMFLGTAGLAAQAAPVKLSKVQLDKVVAGAMTKLNPGGNTPNGVANGVPVVNPAGISPPGQNK